MNGHDRPQPADARELFGKSTRFDLIFKVELARAWACGTPEEQRLAEEAYLETVRARNGFRESDPPRSGPDAFIRAFRKTADSIRLNGYDINAEPIPVNEDGEILNGAHRLAACVAYGKPCLIRCRSSEKHGSAIDAFLRGKMEKAVMIWGMNAYLRRVPDGRLAASFREKNLTEIPFPDWADRAASLRFYSYTWKAREIFYRIKSLFRSGKARQRALTHADRCRHHAAAPKKLADYWIEKGKPT